MEFKIWFPENPGANPGIEGHAAAAAEEIWGLLRLLAPPITAQWLLIPANSWRLAETEVPCSETEASAAAARAEAGIVPVPVAAIIAGSACCNSHCTVSPSVL
ncbi:uncharacterized protein LOC116021193 [Ipomoea triloba]|uniref:uncharacterized protein LOC116021193 n=1 Tax=Ipomoea triloba TaxID=35885 RepID=UPI00125E1673|nr:uncharacterized protein LOC116021193 [Ipomoea triloba]